MNESKIEKTIIKLREYADLDGTEDGELADRLCNLWESYRDYASKSFIKSLEKEIVAQLEHFETYSRIVTVTIHSKPTEYKALEWN